MRSVRIGIGGKVPPFLPRSYATIAKRANCCIDIIAVVVPVTFARTFTLYVTDPFNVEVELSDFFCRVGDFCLTTFIVICRVVLSSVEM